MTCMSWKLSREGKKIPDGWKVGVDGAEGPERTKLGDSSLPRPVWVSFLPFTLPGRASPHFRVLKSYPSRLASPDVLEISSHLSSWKGRSLLQTIFPSTKSGPPSWR